MKLSIVSTLYKSAPYVEEFCSRVSEAARQLVGSDYEIILVNDGSPDNSLDLAVALAEQDPHLVVVDLSRNFGHHKAMMTGLAHSTGDRVFLIDSDLEEEPEWLLSFAQSMADQQCDVVYGVQESRKGNWFERWSGEVYYSVFNWLSNIDHPRNVVTARLMSRRYVDALLLFREREMVISCLWVITGFKQCELTVTKGETSPTTYSLARKFENATRSITSFSIVPLKIIFYTGITIFFISVIYTSFLVVRRLLFSSLIDGWTSVIVSIWLLGGMVISFVGVIGIYLANVFTETKQRPYTIIRAVYGRADEGKKPL